MWCFSGLEKLEQLRVREIQRDDLGDIAQELPLFGWTAIGMDWKLHVAYRNRADNGVVVLGPLDSGGLHSVMAFFRLFRIATALAKWAKETYWAEFRRIVGG